MNDNGYNKSSLKKCIDYGFSDSDDIFLSTTSHLNPIYNNIFNTIQKALKILYKYRIPLTYNTFL